MKKKWRGIKLRNLLWVLFMVLTISTTLSAIIQRGMGVKVPKVWGTSIAFVQTGSMEPSIPIGSMILVHEQDSYQEGDVITYHHETVSAPVTHRIIEINGEIITTQGDANNAPDPEFLENQIIGKVFLTIPYLGYALNAIKNPVVLISILTLMLVPVLFDFKKEPKEQEILDEEKQKKGAVAMTGNGGES